MEPAPAKELLRLDLLGLGFDVVRFARIDGEAPGAAALRDWLAAGMHADMAWVGRNEERRSDPRKVVEGASTLVMLGVNYFPGKTFAADGAGPAGKLARYALYEDYHDTMTPALAEAGRCIEARLGAAPTDYRFYVDTGPLLERSWSAAAGLGFIGRNAMLISRDFGNWLFLSGIILRQELPPDAPLPGTERRPGPGSLCGKCTQCLDTCPTKALVASGVVDARLCISYLTIENKGAIPEALRPLVGDHLYGCDDCAAVCPWNRFAQESRHIRRSLAESGTGEGAPALLRPRLDQASLSLRDILRLTQEDFAAVFRRTPVKRIKRAGLLRNACVVAGNSGDRSLLPELERLAKDESPLIREHAAWAVGRLGGGKV